MNYRDTTMLEHRGERAYDEQDASTLILPNGTLLASFHRPFMTVCARLVLDAHVADPAVAA